MAVVRSVQKFRDRKPGFRGFAPMLAVLLVTGSFFQPVKSTGSSSISIGFEILRQEPRLGEIATLVMHGEGMPSEKLHTEFWSLMQPYLADDPFETINTMKKALTSSLSIDKELWRSLLISVQTRKVFKTDLLKIAQMETGPALLSPEQIAQQDEMLSAAASRAPLIINGELFAITVKRARESVEGFSVMEKRLEKLLNPIWH